MKLIYSIFALVLAGCVLAAASPQAGEPIPDESALFQGMTLEELNLLLIIDEQAAIIEALQGELIALQEAAADYGYVYVVLPGQSLWSIAEEIYGDPYKWITIYSMNVLLMEDPDLIYPGQILLIP